MIIYDIYICLDSRIVCFSSLPGRVTTSTMPWLYLFAFESKGCAERALKGLDIQKIIYNKIILYIILYSILYYIIIYNNI